MELDSLVRLAQQALKTDQDRPDVQHRRPLVLEDVQADPSLEVEVGVVDRGAEVDLRRHKGVSGGELEGKLEGEAGVGCAFGAEKGCVPVEHVAVVWEGGAARRRGRHKGHQFGLKAVQHVSQGNSHSDLSVLAAYRFMMLPLSLAPER